MEKLILERAAANRNRSSAWPPSASLSCLPGNTPDIGALYRNLPAEQPTDNMITNPYYDEVTRLNAIGYPDAMRTLQKFRAVGNTLTSGNLVRALLFSDQIDEWQQTECATAAQQAASRCVDLDNQESRLNRSYPALFGPGVDRAPLRSAVQEVLAARVTGNDTGVASVRTARGRARYQAGLENTDLSELEKEVADNLSAAQLGDPAEAGVVMERLRAARTGLNTAITSVRDGYVASLDASAARVCSKSLEDFIREDSNVVRQALADSSEPERGLMRAVLCESNFATANTHDRTSCYGVNFTTGSGGERVTRVGRARSGFPYGSNNAYEIVTPPNPPGGPSTVRMTLKMVSNIPEEDTPEDTSVTPPIPARPGARTLRARMQQTAQNFFNCQTGGGTPPVTSLNVGTPPAFPVEGMPAVASCPPGGASMRTPPVQFEIGFASAPAMTDVQSKAAAACRDNTIPSADTWTTCSPLVPRVTLHRCYNADLPAASRSDCRAIREFRVGQCVETVDMRRRAGAGSTGDARWGSDMDDYLENVSRPTPDPEPPAAADPTRDAAVSACATEADECARARCVAGTMRERPPIHCFTDEMRADFCEGRVNRETLEPNLPLAPDAGAGGRSRGVPLPPEGDARFNRQNSSNYTETTDAPTVIHEVGHLLGLGDEYLDPKRSFSPPGEHDSMMNRSGPGSRFYPRHLQQILEPASTCPLPATGSAASP